MPTKPRENPSASVLLVDDRTDNLDALEAALAGLGLKLIRASSGEEALRRILEAEFAVVLLDVQMPGMDGYETASLIRKRERTRSLPIIFVTAITDSGNYASRAYSEGAVDFLYKPLDVDVLRAKVSVFVDLYRQSKALEREIALRKRAEAQLERRVRERTRELAQSEERYRAFIANSSEAIWRFELDQPVSIHLPEDEQIDLFFRHAYLAEANDAMARMYGLDRASELIGCRLGDILVREDERNVEYLREFIRSGYRLADVESHERDREGRSKYFLNTFAGIVEDGFVLRAWGTQRDITDRKRSDDALRRNEERVRLILDTALDAVITMDSEGKVIGWNRQAETMFGYTSEEAPGRALADLIIPPNLRAQHWQGLKRYLETGEGPVLNRRIEIEAVRRDGTRFPVELAITPLREGDSVSFSGFVRDISERKQAEQALKASEEQLRLITDALPALVASIDSETRYRFANRAYEVWFGISREEAYGKKMADVLGKPAFAALKPYVMRVLAGEQVTFEIELPHADGRPRHVHAVYVPRFTPSGKSDGYYVLATDISEQKRREREIEELNERLQWAMAETHHRVKNNLQTVAAMVDMRILEHGDSVPAEDLRRFGAYVHTLAAVHDILTAQAKTDGKADVLSMRHLLEKLVPMIQEGMSRCRIDLKADDALLPLRQGTSLSIIANELIQNACRHAKKRVNVLFTHTGSEAELCVTDDGPGFPKGFAPTALTSTGLDLVDNLSRLDLHGSLSFASGKRGGATVTVRFPIEGPGFYGDLSSLEG